MRNLTIQRVKSVVACMGRMQVYIEDPARGGLTINGVLCRRLGELKNGEEKTFSVEEKAAKVFVIADQLSRNFSNDYFQLPAGQEDLFLSGKHRFNPAAGNPFIFNNNRNARALENRRKTVHKGWILLAAGVLAGFLGGYLLVSGICCAVDNGAKTVRYDDMQMSLTNRFSEAADENFDFCYSSPDVAVLGLKEELSLNPGLKGFDRKQYAEMVIQNNDLSTTIRTEGDLLWFTYGSVGEDGYHYTAYVYQTEDAFWLIQFGVKADQGKKQAGNIEKWAKSIQFD